jgi:hypothetical protein
VLAVVLGMVDLAMHVPVQWQAHSVDKGDAFLVVLLVGLRWSKKNEEQH